MVKWSLDIFKERTVLSMTDLLNDRLPPQNIEAEQAVLGAVFTAVCVDTGF